VAGALRVIHDVENCARLDDLFDVLTIEPQA
jgi:hypothetical protein